MQALNGFLDVAAVEVVPERDVPAAEAIGQRICAQWPASDDAWDAARAAIAQGVAAHLAERPELWARALELLALYVDHVRLDEPHPRHEGPPRTFFRGKPVYPAELDLARAVAAELLSSHGEPHRERFFESLNEWGAWEATAHALEARRPRLDAREVLALVTHALRVTKEVGNADDVLGPIQSGLLGSVAAIDEIIGGWLDASSPYVDTEPQVVGLLARWRLPGRTDGDEDRRRLVRQLARLPFSQGGFEAHLVAFRSWPPGASLSVRRDSLLEALERTGPAGGPAALTALAFDANTPPLEALPVLDAIAGNSDPSDARLPFARLRVLRWIGRSLSESELSSGEVLEHARSLIDRLPRPAEVPPDPSWEVDRTLAPLVPHAPDAVREYVLRWLEAHRAVLAERGGSLASALPSTRRLLPGFGWLVDAAVSASPARRRVALWCIVDRDSDDGDGNAPLTIETCGGLTPTQVEGLAHMLLYQSGLGARVVDLLFALARARPDCLGRLKSLLDRSALRTYPGRYTRCVDAWAEAVAGRPDTDPEVEVVENLRRAIAERQRGFDLRERLGQPLFDKTRPTAKAMRELLSRKLRIEEERQRSGFMAIVTRVPIACGEAWDTGNAEPSSLQPMSWEFEGLALDAYDPVAAGLARLEHAREAQRLLGDEGESEGGEP